MRSPGVYCVICTMGCDGGEAPGANATGLASWLDRRQNGAFYAPYRLPALTRPGLPKLALLISALITSPSLRALP